VKLVWDVAADPVEIEAALQGLTALAVVQLAAAIRSGRPLPRLYASGVRYQREPLGVEEWRSPREVLAHGNGDCEDLAAYRAAEIQVYDRVPARAVCYSPRPLLIHCVVRWPDGRIEDPSRKLGMGGAG